MTSLGFLSSTTAAATHSYEAKIAPDTLMNTPEYRWYQKTYGEDKTLTDFAIHITTYSGVYPDYLTIRETFDQAYEAEKAYLEDAKSKNKS